MNRADDFESVSTETFAANYSQLKASIAGACRKAGRDETSVQLIGVSKYVGVDATAKMLDAGIDELGENRPQQLLEKAEQLGGRDVRWHMIGHLQRNKVRRILPHCHLIHSIDSLKLLRYVADRCKETGIKRQCLLEINISGEPEKTGLPQQEFAATLQNRPDSGIEIVGLMGMASKTNKDLSIRQQFARLRELLRTAQDSHGIQGDQLSMGMTNDFVDAIAEGSTMVRVGRRLFADP